MNNHVKELKESSVNKGFTLIEVAVVVAVVGILTIIAVPNFQDARHKTNHARVKSDLRLLATSVDAYTADHGNIPVDYSVAGGGDPEIPSLGITQSAGTSGICHPGFVTSGGSVHPGLTTPVAYVANCWIQDPYMAGIPFNQATFDSRVYTYHWFEAAPLWGRTRSASHGYIVRDYKGYYGKWRLGSVGPDLNWYNSPGPFTTIKASRVYDPTNGLVSYGNIWRGEKLPEVPSRPPADILQDPGD